MTKQIWNCIVAYLRVTFTAFNNGWEKNAYWTQLNRTAWLNQGSWLPCILRGLSFGSFNAYWQQSSFWLITFHSNKQDSFPLIAKAAPKGTSLLPATVYLRVCWQWRGWYVVIESHGVPLVSKMISKLLHWTTAHLGGIIVLMVYKGLHTPHIHILRHTHTAITCNFSWPCSLK